LIVPPFDRRSTMKRLIKKLVLRRDTIRTLSDFERAAVRAGEVETSCTAATRRASGCVAGPESEPPP
jgi:hypothetical protein